MSTLRATLTTLAISAVAAGGMVLSAGPAGAGGVSPGTGFTCTAHATNPALQTCTATDGNGLQTVQVKNTDTNVQQFSTSFDCSPTPTTTTTFNIPINTKYKVFINDCSQPREKTTWVIRADGTVNPVT